MNTKLNEMLASIEQLGSWDLSALLWTLNYQASASIINAAIRAIPDAPPEAAGVEPFTQYREDMRNIDLGQALPYIALKKQLDEIAEAHTDSSLPDVRDTASYMCARVPVRTAFANTFNALKRQGRAPRVTLRQYVDSEFSAALKTHATLVSKCEQAMDAIDGIWSEVMDDHIDLREEYVEMLSDKIRPKLEARWAKAEIRAAKMRLGTEAYLDAKANLALIEMVMSEFGVQVPEAADTESSDEDDTAYMIEAGRLDAIDNRVVTSH